MEPLQKWMDLVIRQEGSSPIYNCMVRIHSERNGFAYSNAVGITKERGETISDDHRIRTGSITKLFTAVLILQLAEEGKFGLDDLYFDLLSEDLKTFLSGVHIFGGVDHSRKITLLQLLQHSTGIPDFFSDDRKFLAEVMQDPLQSWHWKSVMEKYFEWSLNRKAVFVPGDGFHYSDTNYMLLGVLIEHKTGNRLQQVYAERISAPLGLKDTYLEFYDLPGKSGPIVYPYYGMASLENVNTSFDWGGGGLISTMKDLDVFIRNLLKGNLFKQSESLQMMVQGRSTNDPVKHASSSPDYGAGIQKRQMQGRTFFGHYSAYGAMLFYEPDGDLMILVSVNQAAALHKAEWLMNKSILHYDNATLPEK